MQRPDEKKRELIAATAARMFATRPYHEVRLEDVAAQAGVGKGTVYIYFESKEDLYFSLILRGFSDLVNRLHEQLGACDAPAINAIRAIVQGLVEFAIKHPYLFEMMRSIGGVKPSRDMEAKRTELSRLIEKTIRNGVRRGELADPHPNLTSLCIPGLVRSVFLFGPEGLDEKKITAQIMRLLEHGIGQLGAA